jgi:hypothetical protein
VILAACALLALSCKPQNTSGPLAPPSEPVPARPAVASPRVPDRDPTDIAAGRNQAPPIAAGRSDTLDDADKRRRAEGIAALDAGRFDEAKRIFGELLDRHPGNVAVASLYEGASIALGQAQQEAAIELANLTPLRLSPAPFSYTKVRNAPVRQGARPPKLIKAVERRNQITDDERWFRDNGLTMPTWEIPNPMRNIEGNLPPEIPPSFGNDRIVEAIRDQGRAILMYASDYSGGRYVLVLDRNRKVVSAFDFASWSRAPKDRPSESMFTEQRVNWALVRDGVLFVSTGHRTYAKSSGGQNAYISAVNLETGELYWRSAPLVANAANFVLHDGYIITGYGFTAEPDFMYVLDAKTGKTVSKVKVRSGPSVILEKGGRLFVRTYDMDYVFDLK